MTCSKCTFAFVLTMNKSWRCPPHHHYCTELVFCEGCSGTMFVGDRSIRYRAGDILVSQPTQPHWVVNGAVGRQFCFGMDGAGAETIPDGVYRPTKEVALAVELLCDAFQTSSPLKSVRVDLLCGLAAVAIRDNLVAGSDVASKVRRVRDLIDSQYTDEWDTTTLAYQVGMSPDYLRQVFRAANGISVAGYLRKVRLRTAARLLESTEDSIGEIAAASGFVDSSYFSKAFRRHFGRSPCEYRSARKAARDPALRLDRIHRASG